MKKIRLLPLSSLALCFVSSLNAPSFADASSAEGQAAGAATVTQTNTVQTTTLQTTGMQQSTASQSSRPVDVEALLNSLNPEGWQATPVLTSAEPDLDKQAVIAEYGCKTRFARSYQRGQRHIFVNVYKFITPEGAYGAYNFYRSGATNLLVKGDASSEDDKSISVWRDRYFISIVGTSEADDESKEVVTLLTNKLLAVLPGHSDLPSIIGRLPYMDKVKATEKIVMGPLTARRLCPAPSLSLLSFDTALGGAVADYATQSPFRERMKLLVVNYPDPSVAAKAYYRYIKEISAEHPNLLNETENSLFKMGNDSYLLCQLKDYRVVIVTGAKKKQSASLLARQVM